MIQPECPIERAKRLGTYGEIDRSKQYEGELDSLDGVLLRRKLQAKYDYLFAEARAAREREDRKFWHRLALIATTAVTVRIPEIYSFLVRLFQ